MLSLKGLTANLWAMVQFSSHRRKLPDRLVVGLSRFKFSKVSDENNDNLPYKSDSQLLKEL